MVSKATSIGLLLLAIAFIFLMGLWIGPIPQPQSYHHFADQRSWAGVASALNVFSNFAFALVGFWGLFLLFSKKVTLSDNRERWPWVGVAISLILTAIGSAYYHLSPDNARLVWDRLPMTILFMSYISALISERINITLGLWLWPLLLMIGFYSVWSWYWSEMQGNGDLRLYFGVQAFALLATLVMLMTPSKYDHNSYLIAVVIFFALSKIFEMYDHQVYAMSGGIISGHTLKHLAAAFAAFWMLLMVKNRKVKQDSGEYA